MEKPATVYKVDFKSQQLISKSNEFNWVCDSCGETYKRIEGAYNVPYIEVELHKRNTKICGHCINAMAEAVK